MLCDGCMVCLCVNDGLTMNCCRSRSVKIIPAAHLLFIGFSESFAFSVYCLFLLSLYSERLDKKLFFSMALTLLLISSWGGDEI